MNKEELKIEAETKQEKQENKEIPQSSESPEELRQKITDESEKEVASLKEENAKELTDFEDKAAKENLTIDSADKEALQKLDKEAEEAKEELNNEINKPREKLPNGNQLPEDKKNKFDKFVKEKKEFYNSMGGVSLDKIKSDRNSAVSKLEWSAAIFEKYKSEIEKLRSEIDDTKSNIIKRVLKFRTIKNLEKSLSSQEEILKNSQQQLGRHKELVDDYDYLLEKETELASLMEEAQEENKKFDEAKRLEFIAEENERSVETLMKERGVFFVHGIIESKITDGANKVLETGNLNWDEKLDVVLGLEPTLSASTLKPGTEQETHGRRGVIFSRGRALGGSRNDMRSVAHGLRKRSFDDGLKSVESIHEAIGNERSHQAWYNEIILEKPEAVGIYLNLNANGDPDIPKLKQGNDDRFSINGNLFDSWACIQNALKREVGIFVFIENNKVHKIYDVNKQDKTFKITPELGPEDIANMPGAYDGYIGQEKKKAAVMRVFDKVSGLLDEEDKNNTQTEKFQMSS